MDIRDLTDRERTVLRLVGEGLSAREIADALSISSRTVEWHKTKIMDRLGIRTTSRLVRLAVQSETALRGRKKGDAA